MNQLNQSIRSREYTPINEESIKLWREQLKDVKIILFDWDGTLNNDSLKQFVAKKDLIRKFRLDEKFGIDIHQLYHFIGVDPRKLKGGQAKKTGWYYIKERCPQINKIKCLLIYLYYEYTYFINSSVYDYLFKGSSDFLHELKNRGYYLGIATNKGSGSVKKQLIPAKITDVFDSIEGSGFKNQMKPSPKIILSNLGNINKKHKINLKPKNILMVGDSIYDDVQAGIRAGSWTCLVHAPKNALENTTFNKLPNLNLKSIFDLIQFL